MYILFYDGSTATFARLANTNTHFMFVNMYFNARVHSSSWLNCTRIERSPILSLWIRYGKRRLLSRSSAKSVSCFRQFRIATMAWSSRRFRNIRFSPNSFDPYLMSSQSAQDPAIAYCPTLQLIRQNRVSVHFFHPWKGSHRDQSIPVTATQRHLVIHTVA